MSNSNLKNHICFGLLSIESNQSLPQTLNKEQADQLGSQIALELSKVLKFYDSEEVSFALAAALYPSESLLTPGFLLHNNIVKYATAAFQGEQNKHRVLSIGAHQGAMPEGLQPPSIQSPLVHMPFVLLTKDSDLASRFESQLLDKGMVSPPTYHLLSELFGAPPVHANYMTHLDLIAMMHNHYDQVGMHHLWQIIENALLAKKPQLSWHDNSGQALHLINDTVYMPFISGNDFVRLKAGTTTTAYVQFLMAQRLAAEVFRSHLLKPIFFNSSQPLVKSTPPKADVFRSKQIKQPYYLHSSETNEKPDKPQLIDWHHPQAGYVWTTLTLCDGSRQTFYPLAQDADDAIDNKLQSDYPAIMQQSEKQKCTLGPNQEDFFTCH